MTNEYKYEVGDRVHLNDTAFSSIPRELRKHLPKTYKTTIFTVARRSDESGSNQYFIPGYDWQGGSGWIVEEWISKWCGSGPLCLTVAILPEGESARELRQLIEKTKRSISEAMGVPADQLGKIEFTYTEEPVAKLDKAAG